MRWIQSIGIGATPEQVVGPYTLFKRHIGNCYEMAIGLCSLLLGAGYDAYVVSGYATEDIAKGIRCRTECPIKTNKPKEEVKEEVVIENKYKLREIRDLRSKFLLAMVRREIEKKKEVKQKEHEAVLKQKELEEAAPPDELYGWRVHAWVLLMPKRDIKQPIYVESSTGETHPIDTNVYISIESIFNTENYYVNMQKCPINEVKFNFFETSHWEHIFYGEPLESRDVQNDTESDINDQASNSLDEKHLDIPPPWSDAVKISHGELKERFPRGTKITKYKRCILEQYGAYVQPDGLKHRLTYYKDFEYTRLYSIEDTYEHRVDCMTALCIDIKRGIATEYFRRGREDGCKTHIYRYEKNTLESQRTMEFYHDARLDGLSKLEMDPVFMKETFVNREDKLKYRHAQFAPRGKPPPNMVEGVRRIIINLIEKFDRNEAKDANEDIATREFAMVDAEIHLKYHYAKGHVTASTRTFIKPNVTDIGENLLFNPSLTYGYAADVGCKPPKQLKLFYLLQDQLADEQNSTWLIREREDEVSHFIRIRLIEMTVPQLEVSLFNRELNEDYKLGLKAKEQQKREYHEREVDEETDYLAPYIVRYSDTKTLNREQALLAREACIKDFRELLLNRANKLRVHFEKEHLEFLKKQQWFSNNVSLLNMEEEEHEMATIHKMRYRLNLLDVRLQRFRDLSEPRLTALKRYLDNDPRMSAMWDSKTESETSEEIQSSITAKL